MKPIIIIGAPRSGTNILRDALTRLPSLVTWPCDEINLMWRHGNVGHPNDALPADLATPAVQQYLRDRFDRLRARRGGGRVVEKTCANSLRVDFVDRVFPEATYLFIVRDAFDAVASAMRRWQAPLDLGYTLRKLRYVPLGDLPHYATRFVANRWHRLTSSDKRLATWGPIFEGMPGIAATAPLEELCALQWRHCVERAEERLVGMSPQRVLRLQYEDLATHPADTLEEVCDFLALEVGPDAIAAAVADVHADSVGKGSEQLTSAQIARIEQAILSP